MYYAAARIADDFGCEGAIGIQYQQGLKDLMPASDLVEGMLNTTGSNAALRVVGSEIRRGRAMIHFNEVDECAGLDALLISRVHRALGQPPRRRSRHPLGRRRSRGGSGLGVRGSRVLRRPPTNDGGWAGSESLRQPPMYFPRSAAEPERCGPAGAVIWSRIFVENGRARHAISAGGGCPSSGRGNPAAGARRRRRNGRS